MVRTKPTLPVGHGELLARPAFGEWAALARANHSDAAAWQFTVAGRSVSSMRSLARLEALDAGAGFSARMGVGVDSPGSPEGLVVATGHQPVFYHPGVWIKDFLLQRLADEVGGSAIDIVVDSDGFETLSVSSPCLTPEMGRCTQYLAVGSRDTCFACASVPSERDLDQWVVAVAEQLESLPAPAIRRHFAEFSAALRASRSNAENLAELVTFARRRFEAVADTRYLELPATVMSRSEAFAAYLVDIALNAEEFASAYNGALAEYREVNKVRTVLQPFPDLGREGERFELPFWVIEATSRHTLWCEVAEKELVLLADGVREIARVAAQPDGAVGGLLAAGVTLAPKALALTLFVRTFVCDLFIHGVGGGGYDRVTDAVFERYFGVRAPAYVVASTTMYLPLGMHVISDAEVAAARERLNRLAHNPDAMLGDVDFESAAELERALALAGEKAKLVSAIARPDADKKSIGLRIRALNAELAELLAPLRESLEADLAALESQQAATEILTDRTYALCFWSPLEVADKAR